MKKLIILILMISAFPVLASAALECEIVDSGTGCDTNGELLFKLSSISQGGGHIDAELTSDFPWHVCCYNVPGLATTTEAAGNSYAISVMQDYTANGHAAKEEDLPNYADYYLTAPTSVSCAYSLADCAGADTCVLSFQDDVTENAHVSGCDANGFTSKLCCSSGEITCSVTDIFWGIVEGSSINAVEEVGMGQLVLLIIITDNCGDYVADYKISQPDGPTTKNINDIELGMLPDEFGGGVWEGYENVGLALWTTAEGTPPGEDGDYEFYVQLRKAGESTVDSPDSELLAVNSNCIPVDPSTYVDDCYFTLGMLQDFGCPSGEDVDCDGVDDCIDQELITASQVDKCTGLYEGSAGCIPYIDCTMLEWSECYECTAGMDCADEGFLGESVMERCENWPEEDCLCNWIGGRPEGCSEELLDQSDNRFKACITEEEFPVFDGFNFVAVLLLIAVYYSIVLVRRKR